MPWIATTVTPGAAFGVSGTVAWMRPDATLPAHAHDVPIPSSLNMVDGQATWATDFVHAYVAGLFTDNAILTRHWQLWPLGMRAINSVPDVVLAAGPGITDSVVCYVRGYDSKTGERTPLGAPSATLTPANQKITYQNLTSIELNPRWTHLEGWESRDGGLPRFVWRRQVGIASVTHAKEFADLGEAETMTWTRVPRCRYGVFWHNRYILAGDDDAPNTIYIMAIDFAERWEGFTLETKTHRPVTGLREINGQLLVFTAFDTETMSGWTEDDLRIDIVQPSIGLLSNQALVEVDGWLVVPAEEQPYLTNGSAWFPWGNDIRPRWAEELSANRAAYQQMWVDHRPDEHVIRWYVGSCTEILGQFIYWVFDYKNALPLEDGGVGQPLWGYDATLLEQKCAALVAVPGGRHRKPLGGGATYGVLFNEAGDPEDLSQFDEGHSGVAYENNLDIVWPPLMRAGGVGGPDDTATRIDEFTVIQRAENTAWRVRVYSGDVEAYVPPDQLASGSGTDHAAFDKTVLASAVPGPSPPALQPRWSHYFGAVPNVAGVAFIFRITATNPDPRFNFAGIIGEWSPGTTVRRPPGTELAE